MTKPVVTSISFDKSSYEPGDTITATVKYTSANEHGGEGLIGYSFDVGLTDKLTGDTNSGLESQAAEFYVNSGPVAPNPLDVAAAAGLITPGLAAASIASGTSQQVASFTTSQVTASDGDLLVLWLALHPDLPVTVTGLDLAWTEQVAIDVPLDLGRLSAWTAVVPGGGASGTVSVSFGYFQTSVAWDLDLVTGADPATPLIVANSPTIAGGNYPASVTFASPSNPANRLLFGVAAMNGAYQASPAETPTPWTQLATQAQGWPPEAMIETQISPDLSELTASANWNGYPSMSVRYGAAGFELNAFQSGIGLPPGSWTLASNDLASDGTGTAVFEAMA